MRDRLISILVIMVILLTVLPFGVDASEGVTLNPIFAKTPGDSVTISGATNLDEVNIKVLRPNGTILFVEVAAVSRGIFTKTFDLPINAAEGTYTVVAGQGSIVANETFDVKEEISSNADLSNLELSAGALYPIFNSSETTYTVEVACDVAGITITPTAADTWATIKVNGTPVESGQTTGALPLNEGENIIAVEVTAKDGTVKEYTVTVIREAVPATITIDPISDKLPGDSVTISGETTLDEVSIKVIRPNNTILYRGC